MDYLVLLLLVSCQPSLNAYIFSFLFLLQFEFVLFCFFFFNFPSWYRFNFVSFSCWNLSLHIFLIIMIIMPCSGMFRDVPECSMFQVLSTPEFFEGLENSSSTKILCHSVETMNYEFNASFRLASRSFKNTGPNNSTISNRRIDRSQCFGGHQVLKTATRTSLL